MNMKKCSKCNETKELCNFGIDNTKKDGKQSYCKTCQKIHRNTHTCNSPSTTSEYKKLYYKNNKKSVVEKQKIYKEKNIETIRFYQKEYRKNRRKNDINFKINEIIRYSVLRFFNSIKEDKKIKSFNLVTYTSQDLKTHIENKFIGEMSWDNHGTVWELDHIKPIKWFTDNKFLFKDNNEVCQKANELDNLQPLFIEDNRTKGYRY